jgi:hypothetical protein
MTGDEYTTDEISMLMIGFALKNKVLEWPEGIFKEKEF